MAMGVQGFGYHTVNDCPRLIDLPTNCPQPEAVELGGESSD